MRIVAEFVRIRGFSLRLPTRILTNSATKFAIPRCSIRTRDLWREAADSPANQGYHYNHNAETYMEVGLRLGWAMAELLKHENKMRTSQQPKK